jgi:putative Holliday junction resolvase
MGNKEIWLGLDVGERRIGLALGDSIGRIAAPLTTLEVDGTEIVRLPRNMSGEETAQTNAVRQFVERRLAGFAMPLHFQDESLTSVAAEAELQKRKKHHTKGEVDALAATLILQDFLEESHGY